MAIRAIRPRAARPGAADPAAPPRAVQPQAPSPAAPIPAPAQPQNPQIPQNPQGPQGPQTGTPQSAAPWDRQAPQDPQALRSRSTQPPSGGPLAAGPGGGASSWPQPVHQLPQSAAPAGADPAAGGPVVPWKPPVSDPFLQAAQAQAAARPAALGKRFAARLIDTVVLLGIVGALSQPLVSRALAHIDGKIEAARQTGETVTVWLVDGTTAGYFGGVLAVLLVLGALYEALPTAKWGRTLGKKLCGLEVRDIESFEAPSFGSALRRWLVYGVLGVLLVGVVNVLWCVFDRPWRQCWHDKAARTFVAG